MKALIALFLIITLSLALTLPAGVLAASENTDSGVTVTIDGRALSFDVPPVIEAGRVLVPFRTIAQNLGVSVHWNEDTRTVEATQGALQVLLPVGKTQATVSGQPVPLDVPARIIGGRTLVPLRFFSEAFGAAVSWDPAIRRVSVGSPLRQMEVHGFYALGSATASSWTELFGAPYPETGTGRTGSLSHLHLGWFSHDPDGNLLTRSTTGWQRPSGWETVLDAARDAGLTTHMVVHATDQDGRITALSEDPAARARFAAQVAAEAIHYDGVNLNLEGMGLTQTGGALEAVREAMTALVREVRRTLPEDRTLTLTLHAPNSSYRGYDYRALGAIADRIIIMAHDYGPRPEPDALVAEAIRQALTDVPANRLVLGISTPSETPDSLRIKLSLAKGDNLAGVSLWRLGVIGPDRWEVLDSSVRPRT